jgi:hypothetical protein
MGYRSEVGFCIEFSKEPEEFIALMKVDGREVFKDFLQYMYIERHEFIKDEGVIYQGCVHFYHNHWKWYDDSRNGFTDLINMADDFDTDFRAKFVRIGEESDDVEEEWFNDDNYELEYPYMVRMVDTGVKLEKLKKVEETNGSE